MITKKRTINLTDERLGLSCNCRRTHKGYFNRRHSKHAEIKLPLRDGYRMYKLQSFHDTAWCASCYLWLWRALISPPRWVLEENSDKTRKANRVLHLCILAPWVYLWSFQNHTNPKKQLYNKKYFLGLWHITQHRPYMVWERLHDQAAGAHSSRWAAID